MYTSEGILKFYKENLTIVGLTKKKYKVWFYVLFFSFILLTLGGGVMMIMKYYAFFNKNPLIVFGGVIFITILFALIINYLKFSAMKEKNRAYVKYADNIKLNILHFYPLNIELITENFHSQLRSYLQKNKITKKIVEIIFLLEENAKKERTPYFLWTSVFSAIGLIIFSAYIDVVFGLIKDVEFHNLTIGNENKKIDIKKSDIIIVFTFLMLFFLFISSYIAVIVYQFKDFYLEMFTNYTSIVNLIKLLKEHNINSDVSFKKIVR